MTLLKPGSDLCEQCRSSIERAGYFVTDDRQGTRVFYCIDHLMAALRQGVLPLRTVSQKQ